MTQQLQLAGDAMYSALNMLPCRCVFNVPYSGLPEPQVVTIVCARCRSMAAWRLVTAPKPASAAEQAS